MNPGEAPSSDPRRDPLPDGQPAEGSGLLGSWLGAVPDAGWAGGALRSGGRPAAKAMDAEMFLRWKGTIVLVFLGISAIALPCIWLLMPPLYKATAAVRVSPVIARMLPKNETGGVMPLYEQHKRTQGVLLKSSEILQQVLLEKTVRETCWYQEPVRPLWGALPTPLDRLKDALEVSPQRESEFITVSMATKRPNESKLIVDVVVGEYDRVSRLSVSQADLEIYGKLQAEYDRLTKEINDRENLRHNLSKEIGPLLPEESRSQQSTRLGVLESEKSDLERRLAMTRLEIQALKPTADAGQNETEALQHQPAAATPEHRYAQDSEWRQLNLELQARQHELELAGMDYGEAHPRVAQLSANVRHAENVLRVREVQLDDGIEPSTAGREEAGPKPYSLAALQHEAWRLEQELSLLSKDIDERRELINKAGDDAHRLAQYDEELGSKREQLKKREARLQDLETEGKAPLHISVSKATEPSVPDRDRRPLLSAMALLGALMAGLAIAYLRSVTDPRIRKPLDVPMTSRAPFLGHIPQMPQSLDLAADSSPWLHECVRMVRTALLERLAGTRQPVVLITSSAAGTGKTSVAVLLGRSLAHLGKKVLLIEADLHRPRLAAALGLDEGPGLVGVVSGTATDATAIRATGDAGFDVLPTGRDRAGFDAELLANGQFAACLDRWRKTYQFVLLDSPPVLPVADSRILSRHADGTIMVLRSAHSRKPDIVRACADLIAAGGTLLGTIMVGGTQEEGYGYYHDGYSPSYGTPRLPQA